MPQLVKVCRFRRLRELQRIFLIFRLCRADESRRPRCLYGLVKVNSGPDSWVLVGALELWRFRGQAPGDPGLCSTHLPAPRASDLESQKVEDDPCVEHSYCRQSSYWRPESWSVAVDVASAIPGME